MPPQCVVVARSKLEMGRSLAQEQHTLDAEPGILTLLDGLLGGSSLLRTPNSGREGFADRPAAYSTAASTGDYVLSSGMSGFLRFSGPKWRKERIAGESASCEERKNRDVLASLSKLRLREVHRWRRPQPADGLVALFRRSAQKQDGTISTPSDVFHSGVAATPDSEDVRVKSLEMSRRPIVIRAVSQAGCGPLKPAFRPSGWPFSVALPVTLDASDDVQDSGASPEKKVHTVAMKLTRTFEGGNFAALGSRSAKTSSNEGSVERTTNPDEGEDPRFSAERDPLDGSSMFDSCSSSSLASESIGRSIVGDGPALWLQGVLRLGSVKLASLHLMGPQACVREQVLLQTLSLESPAQTHQNQHDLQDALQNETDTSPVEGSSLGFLGAALGSAGSGSDRCRDDEFEVAGSPENFETEQPSTSTWPLDPVSSSDMSCGQSVVQTTGMCSTFQISVSTRESTLFNAEIRKVDEQKADGGRAFENGRKGGKSFHFGDWMQMPLLAPKKTKEEEFVEGEEKKSL